MKRHLIPLLCLLAVANLHANGGGYSKGVVSTSAFQPIGVDQVEMLSERLEIDLHIEYADIRIEYVLHNPGKKVTVECGFPAATAGSFYMSEEQRKARPPVTLDHFMIEADGKRLAAHLLPDDIRLSGNSNGRSSIHLTSWHLVKIPFSQGQTRKVSVSYRNEYFRGSSGAEDRVSLTYLFSAAGLWAGPIKQGAVTVNPVTVDAGNVSLNHPKRFIRSDGALKWSFTDLEPTLEDDLVISVGRNIFTQHLENAPGDELPSLTYVATGGTWKDDRIVGASWQLYSRRFTAKTSSWLKEADGAEHTPDLLHDANRSTAWVEGAEGDGISEHLTLTLDKPSNVRRMGIVNGFMKSRELYFANNRVWQWAVSVNGGKTFFVEVPDEPLEHEYFWIDLPKSSELVKTIKLEIAAIRPGSTYRDTALSEVVLSIPLEKAPRIQPVR
ncbi:MAG TPA: hypothetical protein DDZ88_25930 [Verrucomicrobiales bacterium]|nr:hypothetical protein [Verrucomicrobiales bacterium]